jgi:hypothetical protein
MSWQPDALIVAASCLCWLIIVIAGAVFFDRNRNARLKRWLWPVWITGSSLSFVEAVCSALGHISVAIIAIAIAVGLINLLAQKFCPTCGLSQYANNPFRSDNKCTECGSALSRQKSRAPHLESS